MGVPPWKGISFKIEGILRELIPQLIRARARRALKDPAIIVRPSGTILCAEGSSPTCRWRLRAKPTVSTPWK